MLEARERSDRRSARQIATLELRTADSRLQTPRGMDARAGERRRLSYKIFADGEDLQSYLKKSKGKFHRCSPR